VGRAKNYQLKRGWQGIGSGVTGQGRAGSWAGDAACGGGKARVTAVGAFVCAFWGLADARSGRGFKREGTWFWWRLQKGGVAMSSVGLYSVMMLL
jgi:hypothetical protein